MRTGDIVTIDTEVGSADLAARRASWRPPPKRHGKGYGVMFSQQANEGCDFDSLRTGYGASVREPAISLATPPWDRSARPGDRLV